MDYRFYFVTAANERYSHADTALAAAKGGATIIQFRDKKMNDQEFMDAALTVKMVADDYGLPLIINDRVEIGAKIGAAGVHIGQDDLGISDVRKVVSGSMLVGCSVSDAEQAKFAESEGADYIGAGPVFATGSKDDAGSPIGLVELARICEATNLPVVAIGGINGSNLKDVIKTGAAGAAVISAVADADDKEKAALELRNIWENK